MANEANEKQWVKYIPWAASIVFCSAAALTTLNISAKRIDAIEPKVLNHDIRIAVVEKSQIYIADMLNEIKVDVKEIKKKI